MAASVCVLFQDFNFFPLCSSCKQENYGGVNFANLNCKNFRKRFSYIPIKTLDPDDLSVTYSRSFQICVSC